MEKKIIEEVIIKKKKQGLSKEKLSQRVQQELLKKKRRRENTHKYMSAQLLVKNYREKQKSFKAFRHKNYNKDKLINIKYDESMTNKPIILIRICGVWSRIPKEIQLILTRLNLKDLNNAVILFYNQEILKMIELIDNYITWGYISKTKIEDLLRKRGSINAGNNEVNELDNVNIENSLGKYGIICIEDLIHELSFKTENSKVVLDYLGYFKLAENDEGFQKVNLCFDKGGSTGFRGSKINILLNKMI